MSVIKPFRGIRYSTTSSVEISTRVSPPYDVLSAADKARLLEREPRNFVAIDLPHVPPKDAGPALVYESSAATLAGWRRDGTLTADETPSIYVYYQRYRHAGREYVRRKFFAALRLEEFGRGSVFPHEQTFGGPKEDRLCLMKATQAQLSPIFGLYEDAANAVAGRLAAVTSAAPVAKGTLDGVESTMWRVSDSGTIADLAKLMAPKAIYIADGHHRYGTALMYRDWLASQRGGLPDEHPARFVLCVFCAMEDAGLLILPTHRVLPGVRTVSGKSLAADEALRVLPLKARTPDEAVGELAAYGPQAIAIHTAGAEGYSAVLPASRDILTPIEPARSEAWRGLGLAFLHSYVIPRATDGVGSAGRAGGTAGTPSSVASAPKITYVKSAADAVAEADRTGGVVFLMQPTTMEELRSVCKAGDLMPQKSTYFYPKLASGMVIHALDA